MRAAWTGAHHATLAGVSLEGEASCATCGSELSGSLARSEHPVSYGWPY
jgi:hypothetical protein